MAPTEPGIYVIRHLPTGKVYVGSAVRLSKRWAEHISLLKRGRHYNSKLQAAYDESGADSFTFEVLERSEGIENLHELEAKWIAALDSVGSGFNKWKAPHNQAVLMRECREALGRTETLSFYVTPKEKARIKAQAQRSGMSLPNYMREEIRKALRRIEREKAKGIPPV